MVRARPWQPGYVVTYALQVTEMDPITKNVLSVVYCMCKYHGQELAPGAVRKRKQTQKFKFWSAPWRTDLMLQHNKEQHPLRWAEYEALSQGEKKIDDDVLEFVLSRSIVDIIIGELMFQPDDELAEIEDEDPDIIVVSRSAKITKLRHHAMSLFKANDDVDDDELRAYKVEIKNVKRFQLAIQFVSAGMSFKQAAVAIGHYIRVLVAVTLQKIAFLLQHEDHRGTTFFDVWIRIALGGLLFNLHLIAMPHFGRHTADNQIKMLTTLLAALYTRWQQKLLNVATDGEKTNMGHINGIQAQLVRMAEFPVVQVWCPLHQINLVVKETTNAIDRSAWLSMTYELTVYLRRQDNLITEMGVTNPKKTNRWVALASVLQYNMKHEPKIVSYISQRHEERNAVVPPVLTESWCTLVYVVAPGIERIKQTFAELQHRLLLVSQQRVYIENLLTDMVILYNLRLVEDAEFDDLPASSNIRFGDWYILKQTMIDFILDQGSRAKAHFEALDDDKKIEVVKQVARFTVSTIEGLQGIKAERTARNDAADDDAPPCMPHELVAIKPAKFVSDVLEPHRARLLKNDWTEDDIYAIEEEHRDLVKAYKNEPGIKAIIDKLDHKSDFNESWDQLGNLWFVNLRRLCAGFATAWPNSASVESDFLVLKWEKDAFRTALLDLSLEGIFQSKQFEMLASL
ncbi:hypothetical protein BDL97_07G051700 [Sphagnum fallax]|nr:hypothetical protein BDL97_07G051700 [Sphagnum fallax]